MSQSDDQREEALKRLDERLDAIETERTKSKPSFGADKAASDGYRLLAELVGGVLGGLGLGWGFDRLAGTSPLGMVGGLLIGLGMSVFMIVRQATRMSAKATAEAGPAKSVPFDDEDDD